MKEEKIPSAITVSKNKKKINDFLLIVLIIDQQRRKPYTEKMFTQSKKTTKINVCHIFILKRKIKISRKSDLSYMKI